MKPLNRVPDDVVATLLESRELSACPLAVEWWHVLQVLAPRTDSHERLGLPRMPPAQEKPFGAELGGHMREAWRRHQNLSTSEMRYQLANMSSDGARC